MKTAEELNALKEEVETLNKKLAELSEDELKQVAGGYNGYEIFFYNSQNLSETGEEEKKGYNVGFFPGLSGFP